MGNFLIMDQKFWIFFWTFIEIKQTIVSCIFYVFIQWISSVKPQLKGKNNINTIEMKSRKGKEWLFDDIDLKEGMVWQDILKGRHGLTRYIRRKVLFDKMHFKESMAWQDKFKVMHIKCYTFKVQD